MDSTWPTFVYGGPLAQGLRALKYGPRPERLGGLAQLWCDESPPLPRVDLALPVPLHPRRLRERGFNQVVLLARPLMRKEGITMDYNMLHRRKGGPHQASLPEKERRLAARKAFSLSPRAANLRGLHVLVVDDVMTTGATADACAALVRQAGARQVHVAVLARAPRML
jgi:ComF family protein